MNVEINLLKLEIFIPQTYLKVLRQALQQVDAGHIGNYDCCMSYSKVTGVWRPLDGAHPYIGSADELCEETELKVEVICQIDKIEKTLAAIKKVHPYEEPVIHILPMILFKSFS
jgi:hypothetical protein